MKILALVILVIAVPVWATDYYVDFSQGNNSHNGTSPTSAWKHAPGDPQATDGPRNVILLPGDQILLRGGVIYRGSIVIPASGSTGNPIVYKGDGWGNPRAILDGSELVSGWTPCSSAADCDGNPNWQNIYYALIPDTVPWSAVNLHENGDFLWIAQEPDMPDPFFNDANAHFYQMQPGQMTTSGITDPLRFNQADADYWNGSSILAYVLPNVVVLRSIQSYNVAENRIVYDSPTNNPAGYDRYSIYNSLHAIDLPGEYYCDPRSEGGTRRIYLWPRNPAALGNGGLSASHRRFGVNIGANSHLVIEGFEIRQYAGNALTDGIGIGCHSAAHLSKSGLVVRNNFIHDNLHPDGGYGGVYLSHCDDSRVENNVIHENMKHAAIFGASCQRLVVNGNDCHRAGGTTLRFYTCSDTKVIRNTVSEGKGTHANGLTFYLSCNNILADGNFISDSNIALTYQESNNLTFINNVFDGSERTSFVVASWNGNTGTVNFINNTIVGSTSNYALYISDGDQATYRIKNNIIDGGGRGNTDHTNNLYTANAWNQQPYAAGESLETDLSQIFVDHSNQNYRLMSASPAIDNGLDTQSFMPTTQFPGYDFQWDIVLTPRPQGVNWDLGAYEYTSSMPVICIVSPNGGENWRVGETHDITWTANGVTGNLVIELLQNGELVGTIATVAVSPNRYSWQVGRLENGSFVTGSNLKVRIRSASGQTVGEAAL